MKTGFEVFMESKKSFLSGKKLAYLGNCASVAADLKNSFDYLQQSNMNWTCMFSPQHGFDGVEQANMIPSSDDFRRIPLFSLYTNKTRCMTLHQLDHFDTLIIDLQDVGCRIYTFTSTVLYALKSCAEHKKSVILLDRPNPAGRAIEGSLLNPKFQSFVGAWTFPIRYGLTLGELAQAYVSLEKLDLSFQVISMENYAPGPFTGWPQERFWIPPSPNMPDLQCIQCYPGTVLLEGTTLSEGRGTTLPLKVFGFPGMKAQKILHTMSQLKKSWMNGCSPRPCVFKPTFDKFKGELCSAIHLHVHKNTSLFRPYRWVCLFLKACRTVHPERQWLLKPPYEYEYEKWPLDILCGDDFVRNWVEDSSAKVEELEQKLCHDEALWLETSKPFHLYPSKTKT